MFSGILSGELGIKTGPFRSIRAGSDALSIRPYGTKAMQKNWDEMTGEQKLIFLRDSLGTFATRKNLTGILGQIQELQGAVSQLEKRVSALENRPAVGS
jgi:hypothetical protein